MIPKLPLIKNLNDKPSVSSLDFTLIIFLQQCGPSDPLRHTPEQWLPWLSWQGTKYPARKLKRQMA